MRIRYLGASALVAAAVLLPTAPAWAHTHLVGTTPAKGSTVAKTRKAVTATFDEQIRGGTLTVKNARGVVVSVGKGGVDPKYVRRLKVLLKPNLKAGHYSVHYTVIAPDGDRQAGDFGFDLR